MAGIPILKISGLVMRALAKPVAKQLRENAGHIAILRTACVRIGQSTHHLVSRLSHFSAEGIKNHHKFVHVDLKQSEALKNGAEVLSEAFVVGVAASVAVLEFHRNNVKKVKDEEHKRAAQAEKDAHINARLSAIERALEDSSVAIKHLAAVQAANTVSKKPPKSPS